jgi:iron complex transport system substrate-binding protein
MALLRAPWSRPSWPARHASGLRIGALVVVVALALVACGDDDTTRADDPATSAAADDAAAAADDTTGADPVSDDTAVGDTAVEPGDAPPSTETDDPAELDADAPDLGRVVVLAEEFMFADVLALGVEPIASSASVPEVGFQGMDDVDTAGVEVLPMTTLNLEHLATLQPDTIITLQFWLDQIGAASLEGMADVVAIPDGLSIPERLTALGDALGRPEHAAAVVAELEAAVVDAAAQVGDGCVVSLAAIYPGPSVAAFVAGPWDLPTGILDVGCTLDPDATVAEPDGNGRVWLSAEQYGILDADVLVLLQSDTVEGEPDAVAALEQDPLWTTLPAVAAGEVLVFDRLGYPGARGQMRFVADLADALG